MGHKSKNQNTSKVKEKKKQEPQHIIKHDKWTETKGDTDSNIHTHVCVCAQGKANQMQVKYMIAITGGCTVNEQRQEGQRPDMKRKTS